MLQLLVVLQISLATCVTYKQDHMVFWSVKPFIYYDDTNNIVGMIPHLFREIRICNEGKPIIDYNRIQRKLSQQEFYQLFESNTNYSTAELANVTERNVIWGPILKTPDPMHIKRRNVYTATLTFTPDIAVVVHRERISVLQKIVQGIMNSKHVLVIVLMIGLFFSILIWIAECIKNKQFSRWFIKGFGTSIWWSCVTMTTVGYGDVTPVSLGGRCIGIIWMLLGLAVFSTLTGTFTTTMTENTFLSIQEAEVAALNSSFEAAAVKKNYNSRVIGYDSYDDVMKAVERGDQTYGIFNSDIAANMEMSTNYPTIAVVQLLPIKIPVPLYISITGTLMNNTFTYCLEKWLLQIMAESESIYRIKNNVQVTYVEDLTDFMQKYYVLYPCICLTGLIFAGLIFDLVHLLYTVYKNRKGGSNTNCEGNKNDDIPLTVIQNGHAHEDGNEVINPNRDIKKDIAIIKDQLLKINAMSMYKQKCPVCSWQT